MPNSSKKESLMDLDAFRRWTERLRANLAQDERVIGLVMLGSSAEQRRLPDAWSDHDFFVITRPGVQEALRQTLDWLPDADHIVLRPRETDHGLKVLFDDGHVIEFAVFDMADMRYARVNDWRVLLEPPDGSISALLREYEARDAVPPPFDPEREIGLMLSLILIGSGRVARGEIISGGRFIKDFALSAFLRLLANTVTPAPGSIPDNLDPFRRVERCYPQIAPRLHAALLLPPLDAASALLDLAETTLADMPTAAVAVVRGEIERARHYNG
jgi:hypothetical protein